MVKAINKEAFAIKALLKKGFSPIKVARILGLSRQKVNYWRKTEIKSFQLRRKKLDDSYINKIYELAKDKTTSQISSRKIANLINEEFREANILTKNEKPLKICHSTICHYLNQKMGRPWKIRKAFYLTKKQMKKRVDFCKKIIEKKINGDNVFFTDETKIDMSPYTNDSIRLANESKIKLKRGDLEVYDLINRQEKKFEKSLIIAGGLSAFGLSRLIVLEGTLNEFAYGQSLLNFKEDIDSINNKYNANLFLEQDGARAHTSKSNLKLIKELFGDKWIQNPPNSPDLAFPIETLWGLLNQE